MSLLQPPQRRKLTFMLTPLVDVMFLVLIFFMLSSQTSPYSLLQIFADSQGETTEPAAPAPAPVPVAATAELVVSVGNGFVRLNGNRVELGLLAGAIERYKAAGFARAVVLTTRAATVQDVVTVLETFEMTAFGDTQLLTERAPE